MKDGDGWVPVDACTLPTTEQPLREREFDQLFTRDLARVDGQAPTRLVLVFEDRPGLAAELADLTARESECCSFFDFATRRDGESLELVVEVPATRAAVLAGLAERARQALVDPRG